MTQHFASIAGWGKYVPQRVLTNADLAQMVDTSDEWIITRSGIRERHIVGADETNSQMATDAAREALCVAGLQGSDLDLIIIATTTPDYLTPPVSSQVQDALGAHNVGAFTLSVGCPGFLYGLATGSQFIGSGQYQHVLVVGVEIISRFTNYKDRGTCVLFGDGAGAVVLRAVDQPCGVLAHVLGSDGSGHRHIIVPAGGSRQPPSAAALEEDLHYIQMNGREVFKFATRVVGRAIDQALERAGLTIDDVDLIIPHQANLRIIESAAQYYGVSMDRFFVNIDRYGNTSAASIPIALCEAIDQGRAKAGDTLAFVAFGAGLTWAATIVRI